jgi:RNA polymerase sigma factor (sigma-70 family)
MSPAIPFEEVVAEHGSAVWRVCRALLAPVDAEDAWSETFLSALQAYPRLRPGSNVRGWLVTIAHRKAIDRIRAATRAPLRVPADQLAQQAERAERAEGVDPGPELASDRDPQLWGALAALPFKQRAAIAYHHLAGLPYADVGVLLGTNAAAARRNAADGLATLRRHYHGTNDDHDTNDQPRHQ